MEPMEPESRYTFVVYDKGTGRIHHIHQVINLPGAEVQSREQMEQKALSYVPSHEKEKVTAGLAVLSVLPDEMKRGKSYRVDHEKRSLIIEQKQ
jgi:hypothetical protein